MRQFKIITEQPFKSEIGKEWLRAKKILKPLLDGKQKPTFMWDFKMGNHFYGRCCGSNAFLAKPSWEGKKWYHAPLIKINGKYLTYQINGDNFANIVRHEIAHIPFPNHKDAFKHSCIALGSTRFANHRLPKG